MAASAQPVAYRILVIEDCRVTAEGMRLLLETFGHQVALAYTGESGVTVAAEFQPDVVLCDIGLSSGMDGFAVARALRAQGVSAYLVAVTGQDGEAVGPRAREAGFDLHLTKPLEPGMLRPLLAQLPAHTGAPTRAPGGGA